MPTFLNFITLYPDRRYNQNNGASSLFNRLCNLEIIGDMFHYTAHGLPAVGALPQSLIDDFYSDPDFPLSKGSNRQCVGKMIRYIMNLYGYVPLKQGGISKKTNIYSVFSSGHIYKKY